MLLPTLPRMTLAAAASSSFSSPAAWIELAGKLAPLSSVLLFAAPLPTIQKIGKDKTVGSLPLLPYSSMLANAFIWTVYGLMRNESKVYYANGIGVLLAVYYLFRFIKFAPKASPTLPGSVQQHLQVVSSIVMAIALTATSPLRNKSKIIGLSGVVVCIGLFASPLAALKVVFDTKSAASIPLPLALGMTLNGLLWASFGAWGLHDANIAVPSALGFVSGVLQIALKLIYGNGSSSLSKQRGHKLPI
jgi:solute carrier family 50 protein (sugar transporter)